MVWPAAFQKDGKELRRSDLIGIRPHVIAAETLSNRYFVGHRQHQQQATFREMLTRDSKELCAQSHRLWQWSRDRSGRRSRGILSVEDVSFEVLEGGVHLLKCRGLRRSCTEMPC
jgi:hypothetical protein